MIHQPIILEVAKDTYMINLMGLQAPSLIVGRDRALLLDTGLGNFDMMEIVRRITDKPVMYICAPPAARVSHRYAVLASRCIERATFSPSKGLSSLNFFSILLSRGMLALTQSILQRPSAHVSGFFISLIT